MEIRNDIEKQEDGTLVDHGFTTYVGVVTDESKDNMMDCPIYFADLGSLYEPDGYFFNVDPENPEESLVTMPSSNLNSKMISEKYGIGYIIVEYDHNIDMKFQDVPYYRRLCEMMETMQMLEPSSLVCIHLNEAEYSSSEKRAKRERLITDINAQVDSCSSVRIFYSNVPELEERAVFTGSDIAPAKVNFDFFVPQYQGDVSRLRDVAMDNLRRTKDELFLCYLVSGVTDLYFPTKPINKVTDKINRSPFSAERLGILLTDFTFILTNGHVDTCEMDFVKYLAAEGNQDPSKLRILPGNVPIDLYDPNVARAWFIVKPTDDDQKTIDELADARKKIADSITIWKNEMHHMGIQMISYPALVKQYKRGETEFVSHYRFMGEAFNINAQIDAYFDGVPLADILS